MTTKEIEEIYLDSGSIENSSKMPLLMEQGCKNAFDRELYFKRNPLPHIGFAKPRAIRPGNR